MCQDHPQMIHRAINHVFWYYVVNAHLHHSPCLTHTSTVATHHQPSHQEVERDRPQLKPNPAHLVTHEPHQINTSPQHHLTQCWGWPCHNMAAGWYCVQLTLRTQGLPCCKTLCILRADPLYIADWVLNCVTASALERLVHIHRHICYLGPDSI